MENTVSGTNDYYSLQEKDQKIFFNILNTNLIHDASNNPQKRLQDLYNSVWEIFQEEKKKSSRKKSNKDQISTPKKEESDDNLDPFQIYVKLQSKQRKDEFKNVSEINKQKIFAHEWHALTEAEKQRVIDENGRFRK